MSIFLGNKEVKESLANTLQYSVLKFGHTIRSFLTHHLFALWLAIGSSPKVSRDQPWFRKVHWQCYHCLSLSVCQQIQPGSFSLIQLYIMVQYLHTHGNGRNFVSKVTMEPPSPPPQQPNKLMASQPRSKPNQSN